MTAGTLFDRRRPLLTVWFEACWEFATENVANGATVITGGWTGYLGLSAVGFTYDRHSQRAAKAHGVDLGKLLPGVHRIVSLAKRWLLGKRQGAEDFGRLPGYLDEFVFRFNGRKSTSRGLLSSTGSSNWPAATA